MVWIYIPQNVVCSLRMYALKIGRPRCFIDINRTCVWPAVNWFGSLFYAQRSLPTNFMSVLYSIRLIALCIYAKRFVSFRFVPFCIPCGSFPIRKQMKSLSQNKQNDHNRIGTQSHPFNVNMI